MFHFACRWQTACLLLLLVFPIALGARGAMAEDRLSVVIILVDDLGWADLSCQGSSFYETPHVDRLAPRA